MNTVCRTACEITCHNSKATWLFWDLQVRWTFRWRLHRVRRQSEESCKSLLWHDHCWRRMDGL